MAWIDSYAIALRQALPAAGRENIRDQMEQSLGRTVSLTTLDYVLGRVRSDPARFGFTVPQVQPGPVDQNRKRFLAMEWGNQRRLTNDERTYMYQGAFNTVATVLTKNVHLAKTLELSLQHLPRGAFYDHVEEVHDAVAYAQRRAQRLLNLMTA